MKRETKRIGRFFISTFMFYHYQENIAKTLALIKFLPLRVEHRADLDAFEMAGISDNFEEISYGDVAPMYEMRIRNDKEGNEFVEVVRVTNDKGTESNSSQIH